ncbi:hypothetical protein [uncultured Phycicoccus sp.]|uniref:hypothetical protein n=1 Tax=uncultured Phycicoccus sp. TaxID=661422 RepID=UPI002638294B|nr:hypothetical protein [uncultured Phycicoccus sp.]
MPASTPSERHLIARAAAHHSWATTANPTARTAPARGAFLARFEDQVDPDRQLSDDERARRATNARKAYFANLARKSAQHRRDREGRRLALEELASATMLLAACASEDGPPDRAEGGDPSAHTVTEGGVAR